MFKSTITSKGQLTIPKGIREYLDINTGDNVIFKIDDQNKIVTFEKDNEMIECPVCKGLGSFSFNSLPCFICDQSKYVNAKIPVWQQIGQIQFKSIEYGVAISVISQKINEDGKFSYNDIPEIKLYSKKYPDVVLNIAHDFMQMKLIKEFVPRSLSEPDKFMVPSDIVLSEILKLLKRDESKEEVRKWFRYEKTILSSSEAR